MCNSTNYSYHNRKISQKQRTAQFLIVKFTNGILTIKRPICRLSVTLFILKEHWIKKDVKFVTFSYFKALIFDFWAV